MRSKIASWIGFLLVIAVFVAVPIFNEGNKSKITIEKEIALLDTVKERGYLVCGVNAGLPGFASEDEEGNWSGLDVDFCRAVSAAVFGDADKVEYIGLNSAQRFPTLASGSIDVLSRNTTWTISRDVNLMFEFAGVSYYDGQGFLVPTELEITSARGLDGAFVCIAPETTSELNLNDYFAENNMAYRPVYVEGCLLYTSPSPRDRG